MLDDRERLTEHHLELHEASRVGEGMRDRHLRLFLVSRHRRVRRPVDVRIVTVREGDATDLELCLVEHHGTVREDRCELDLELDDRAVSQVGE